MPQQSWTTAEKSIWLLYVAEKNGAAKEMSVPQITNTFNKHFRQAKPIFKPNVHRDLGKLKASVDAPVSENTTARPYTCFLTHAGQRMAEGLVTKSRENQPSA